VSLEDRPSGAIVVTAVGLALHVAAFAFIIVLSTIATRFWTHRFLGMGEEYMSAFLGWILLWFVSGVLILFLGFVGVVMMNSPAPDRVRAGSIIVLLIAILAFPTFWGFFIGSLLMFAGAILGLVWQP
jgi:hypothetical protein